MRLLESHKQKTDARVTMNLKPMLEALARPLRERGIDVTTECEYANVLHEGLLDRAKRTTADLIVKDTPSSFLGATNVSDQYRLGTHSWFADSGAAHEDIVAVLRCEFLQQSIRGT